MTLPLSIIIPTLNEAKYLPKLLKSIKRQSVLPKEVIIADALSIDNTVKVAKTYGCKVIQNRGWIGAGRNAGAKAATQPILLFLDADVVLPTRFLEKTIAEMLDKDYDVASCFVKPMSSLKRDVILHEAVNYYFRVTKNFSPHGPGFCIFITKKLHKKIHGFDESLVLAEDHDYVKRAERYGKFGYLTSYKIPVSVRRLAEEGRMRLTLKYIGAEIHTIILGKIRKNLFSYKFGEHYY